MSDIFTKFNEINLQLQGNDVNLIKVKSAISTFLSKCKLFKRNLARHELYQFPSLCELDKEKSISNDDLQVYCAHLEELQRDMSERFQDLLLLKMSDWVINPFLDVSNKETGEAEEELISIQNDIELSPKFKKSYQDFWLQKKKNFRLLSSIMEQGEDIFYCFSNIIFGRTGLQCSCLASFQSKEQT